MTAEMFATRYSDVFKGDEQWQKIKVEGGATYGWPMASTYVQNPPYFEGMTMTPEPVTDVRERAHPRAVRRFDHDRPHLAGRRHQVEGPAGKYLREHQVPVSRSSTPTARAAATTKS